MRAAPKLRKPSRSRRALFGLLLGLIAAGLALLWRTTTMGTAVELRSLDERTRLFAEPERADPRIVLVQIQDADVAWLRDQFSIPWPWELEVNAQIFDLMADAGVRAVLVDVLQLDRGAGPEDVPANSDQSEGARQRRELEMASADLYGAALKRLKSVGAVALGEACIFDLPARRELALSKTGLVADVMPGASFARSQADFPVLGVLRGVVRIGFVNAPPDEDGILRRAHVVANLGSTALPSLAAAGAELVVGEPLVFDNGAVQVGEHRQALMEGGSFLVSFRKDGRNAYPSLAPARILQWALERQESGEVPAAAREALGGRIVVWGINLRGNEDVVPTPVSENLDGPEFQATALDNLLQGDGRVTLSRAANTAILLPLLAMVGLLAFGAQRRRWMHLLPLLAVALLIAAALWFFARGTAIDLATPGLGLALLWALMAGAHLLTEGRRNRWLEGTFSRYLSPAIIQKLKEDPSLLELGGRQRVASILFSDIEGFTSQSERLTPEQLVALLNEYLTQHSEAVLAEGGVVDKFIGDAVMAFYGDPVPTLDHALCACRTALAVRDRLPQLGELWKRMGLTSLRVRFGINTGPVVVGNMGSHQRLSYTAMGDTVNLASRLESANRFFGSTILLGEQTATAVAGEILTRPIARLRVKGKAEPVGVYEALAIRDRASKEQLALVEHYVAAHEALLRGDLGAAQGSLSEALALRPDDGPTRWLSQVRDQLVSGARSSPWDGVWVLTEK